MLPILHKLFPSRKITLIGKVVRLFCIFSGFWAWQNCALAQEMQPTKPLKPIVVGASAIVEHPSLSLISEGAKAELLKEGYQLGKTLKFIYQTAQNRQATAVQIANKFVGDEVNILLPIGTGAAQASVNATKTIPIVFAGVTDPVVAGLVQNPQQPEKNVTGISDLPDLEKQFALIKEILPNAKTIGFMYNPSEPNSVVLLKKLKTLASKYDFTIVESTAIQTAQVRNAALALVGKVDAIYIGTDNTVVSALETALNVANTQKIPVFTADTDSVTRGALATYSTNYYQLGKAAGRLIIKILNGTPISQLPVETVPATDLILNEKTAKKIGVSFTPSLLSRATKIIQ